MTTPRATDRPTYPGITALEFRRHVEELLEVGAITLPQRHAVLLRADGFSWSATARVLRCEVRTARTHYHRAVDAILSSMEVG